MYTIGSFSLLQWITKLKWEKQVCGLYCFFMMHKGSFSVYSATGLLTQISSSEYLVLLTSLEENRFNGTEILQCTEAEPAFYYPFSPWTAVWLPNYSLLSLRWGLPLCQDWFHLPFGITLLNQGREISVFREWLIWPILDVIFSLRRITPLIQTRFTLS